MNIPEKYLDLLKMARSWRRILVNA